MKKGIRPYEKTEYFRPWSFSRVFGIPNIDPVEEVPNAEFIGFNYATGEKHPRDKAVHFYLDDYQFERVWKEPPRYMSLLARFKFVLSPDYSIFTDMPFPVGLYAHYKKHWLAAYWQECGLTVIPTICWGDESTYDWCFEGEPVDSIVSVSSCGCAKSTESKRLFNAGYRKMVEEIFPSKVIFFGMDILDEDIDRSNVEFHEMGMAKRFTRGHADGSIRVRNITNANNTE